MAGRSIIDLLLTTRSIITDWHPWFKKALQNALPDFPIQTLQHFTTPQVSSMLPSIDYNEGGEHCDQ